MKAAFMSKPADRAWQAPGFKKCVWIFTSACFLGCIMETIYCLIVNGHLESKQGLIYGPFTPVYGIGALIMTFCVVPVSRRGWVATFTMSALLGGVVEFLCSFFQEVIWKTVSWDFGYQRFSIAGRTSLFFMLCWGFLGCIYVHWLYPSAGRLLNRFPITKSTAMCAVLVVFFAVNILVSGLAVHRWVKRDFGLRPRNAVEVFFDRAYPDAVMRDVFPSMRIVGSLR